MRVPPQHELLDDEEHPEPGEERDTQTLRRARAGGPDRLGQEREQRRPEQRPGREAHEVGQETRARAPSGTRRTRTANAALAMPPRVVKARIEASTGSTLVSFFGGDFAHHPSTRPMRGRAAPYSRQMSAAMRPQRPSRRYEKKRADPRSAPAAPEYAPHAERAEALGARVQADRTASGRVCWA